MTLIHQSMQLINRFIQLVTKQILKKAFTLDIVVSLLLISFQKLQEMQTVDSESQKRLFLLPLLLLTLTLT